MTSTEQIEERLDKVLVPGVLRSPLRMNMLRGVNVDDGTATVSLAAAALSPALRDILSAEIGRLAGDIEGVSDIRVEYTEAVPKDLNSVKQIVAVMSGKGGVGKSLVTALTAVALRRGGYDVGILDADITGPSIPKMFGVSGRPAGSETGMLPVPTRSGVEVMSINLILPEEDDAVIWRGPLIARMITQFWEDVFWGKLDYLIVDLPPGTADAPLTVLQSLPVSGVIIVFTPQDLTQMVVRKAVNMAKKMEKPILGVVENMSYLTLPETGKRLEVFGKSRGQEMAAATRSPLLASLPLDPGLAALCDAGDIEKYSGPGMNEFAASLEKVLQDIRSS
jgi:Mrp family chromosome partitioning ATPase